MIADEFSNFYVFLLFIVGDFRLILVSVVLWGFLLFFPILFRLRHQPILPQERQPGGGQHEYGQRAHLRRAKRQAQAALHPARSHDLRRLAPERQLPPDRRHRWHHQNRRRARRQAAIHAQESRQSGEQRQV